MWPISMPRPIVSGEPQREHRSPSRDLGGGDAPEGSKSRPMTTFAACLPGSLAPVTQALPRTTSGSTT